MSYMRNFSRSHSLGWCERIGKEPVMTTSPAARARGPYRNGIRRRREIIEAAAKVFGQYGYAGGSLRQIAQDVGVTPAALARHFESKEGLLIAVLEHWDEENDKFSPPSLHGLDRFKNMIRSIRSHMQDRGLIEMFLTIAAEASNPHHPLHTFIQRRYERVVRHAVVELTRARDAGEVRWMSDEEILMEVRGVYSLMDGIQLQWLLDPTMDLEGTFKRCLGDIISKWTGVPTRWDEFEPEATAAG